jgi:DNA-binding transcriptional ArsR family regulator
MMLREYEMVLKAAADPNRVRILKMLESGELCVCQITAVLDLSGSTVSKHLSLLQAAGLVDDRKDGRWVHFRLATDEINDYAQPLLSLLHGWLRDDAMIAADVERVRRIRELPVEQFCCSNPGEVLDRELACAGGGGR